METINSYNNYLIVSVVLKVVALCVAGAIVIVQVVGKLIIDLHTLFGIFICLLLLIPNSFLAASSKRAIAYLAVMGAPIGLLAVGAVYDVFFNQASSVTDETIFNAGVMVVLFSFAPVSLLVFREGLRVAKEHGIPNPTKDLWMIMGGGSGAIITFIMLTCFTIVVFFMIDLSRNLIGILFTVGFATSLSLLFIVISIIKAIKLGKYKFYLLYTGYAAPFAALIFYFIISPLI